MICHKYVIGISSAIFVYVISCTVLSYKYSHGFVEMLRPHLSMHGGEGEAPRRGGQIRDNDDLRPPYDRQ